MSKDAIFTMKLEPDLRREFMAAAEASHRPASQVVRELMRDYVRQQREGDERERFIRQKVDAARRSVADDTGRDDRSVEADFARRRAATTGIA